MSSVRLSVWLPIDCCEKIHAVEGRTFDEKLANYIRYHSKLVPDIEQYLEAMRLGIERRRQRIQDFDDRVRRLNRLLKDYQRFEKYLVQVSNHLSVLAEGVFIDEARSG